MRSNLKSKSSSGIEDMAGSPGMGSTAPPEPATATDNVDDPSKQHQMSAIWPLLWLLIPLVSLILYGLLSRS